MTYLFFGHFFLPRDAMYSAPMPLCGVCPFVCPLRSCIVSKRVDIFFNFCHLLVVHRSSFSTGNVTAIFRRDP